MTYNNYNILMTSYQNVMNHRYMELESFNTLFFCFQNFISFKGVKVKIMAKSGANSKHLHVSGIKYLVLQLNQDINHR